MPWGSAVSSHIAAAPAAATGDGRRQQAPGGNRSCSFRRSLWPDQAELLQIPSVSSKQRCTHNLNKGRCGLAEQKTLGLQCGDVCELLTLTDPSTPLPWCPALRACACAGLYWADPRPALSSAQFQAAASQNPPTSNLPVFSVAYPSAQPVLVALLLLGVRWEQSLPPGTVPGSARWEEAVEA